MYSQNSEETHITEFFKDFKGTLLDIGANDGKTFSNSLKLIEKGWSAVLVEPSSMAMTMLRFLHRDRKNVQTICCALGAKDGPAPFHESGVHLPGGKDWALLSTLKESEKEKWNASTQFTKTEVDVLTYKSFLELIHPTVFDFISIDAEGMDLEILRQIDLSDTKLLCIEWNLNNHVKDEIMQYTGTFGMNRIIYQSPENLLITR